MLTRRTFIKLIASSGGLCVSGFSLSALADADKNPAPSSSFNLFTLHPDNSITFYNSRSEMGQGVITMLAQLLLEELDADWSQIKEIKNSWADKARFGHQNTIGAISSFLGWESHRQAGAAVKTLLRQTAAKLWQIDENDVTTAKGRLFNHKHNTSLSYGELCSQLNPNDLPTSIELKSTDKFGLIGKSMPRLDIPDKVTGKAQFGIDQQLPNMKVAVVERCPVFGGTIKTFDDTQARQVNGVLDIFAIPSGVAIIAEGFWQAQQARKKLAVVWDKGEFQHTSSESLTQQFTAQLNTDSQIITDHGNVKQELAKANQVISNDFNFPFVAHMTMEPMNCTVWRQAEHCNIWAPTQNPNDAVAAAAHTLNMDAKKITVQTTLMGGGFGRRAQDDFVIEACAIANQTTYPIKLIWSREDDIQHDFYRPLNCQRINATLSDGKIQAWQHKVATLATSPYHFSREQRNTDEGNWIAYGGAEGSLYQIEHFQTQVTLNSSPMTVGILRGISHGYVNFASEMTIDQLAQLAQQDPIQFRLAHIQDERAQKVLTTLQNRLSIETSAANQRAIGIAFGHEKAGERYQYFNAAAALVEKTTNGQITLSKVILVLDHGHVINPDGLLAQAQGSVIFAQSMMFQQAIELQYGQVRQTNFHDYPVTRMGEQCAVELLTVSNNAWPMGTGEKLQGTIQPAIANAISRLTGKPIRSIPINLSALQS